MRFLFGNFAESDPASVYDAVGKAMERETQEVDILFNKNMHTVSIVVDCICPEPILDDPRVSGADNLKSHQEYCPWKGVEIEL